MTPALTIPRAEPTLTVNTDACEKQIRCVLLQEQPDCITNPIRRWYEFLNDAERRYHTMHWEQLTVAWYLLMLRPYLKGTGFKIRSDHDSLRWILNVSDTTGGGLRGSASEYQRPLEDDFPVIVLRTSTDRDSEDEVMSTQTILGHPGTHRDCNPSGAIILADDQEGRQRQEKPDSLTIEVFLAAQETHKFCNQ